MPPLRYHFLQTWQSDPLVTCLLLYLSRLNASCKKKEGFNKPTELNVFPMPTTMLALLHKHLFARILYILHVHSNRNFKIQFLSYFMRFTFAVIDGSLIIGIFHTIRIATTQIVHCYILHCYYYIHCVFKH